MDKKTERWIKMMNWCSNYWGCHQLPERSFFYKGFQFPVCARCTGIISGYILAILLLALGFKISLKVCAFLIIPMALDGTVQLVAEYKSNNFRRFFTGLFSGIGFLWAAFNLIMFLV